MPNEKPPADLWRVFREMEADTDSFEQFSAEGDRLGTLHVMQSAAPSEGPPNTSRRWFFAWARIDEHDTLYDKAIATFPTLGGTLLEFPEPFDLVCKRDGDEMTIRFVLDEQNRLAAATGSLQATSWEEAFYRFRSMLGLALSNWSWSELLPLAATQVGIEDLETGRKYQTFVMPSESKKRATRVDVYGPYIGAFQTCFSFVREGLTSLSPAYRVLCYYKAYSVLQTVETNARKDLVEAGITSHREFTVAMELRVEAGDLYAEVWPDAVGKKISTVFQDNARLIRNQIAHELVDQDSEESELRDVDDADFWHESRQVSDAMLELVHRYGNKLRKFLRLMYFKKTLRDRRRV